MGALCALNGLNDWNTRLIDYFALVLGHGLLAIALLRLAMSEELDETDPVIEPEEAAEEQAVERDHRSRRGKRRARR